MQSDANAQIIEKVKQYFAELRGLIHALEIYPRSMRSNPFDFVGLATLSKAFGIADACLILLEHNHHDEAYGLSRSAVECSLNMRFITYERDAIDQRSYEFLKFEFADKRFWLEHLRNSNLDPQFVQAAEEYAKRLKIEERQKNPRAATSKHWSGMSPFAWNVIALTHPLDASSNTLEFRKRKQAVAYYWASQYVHCSSIGINNYSPDIPIPGFARRTTSGAIPFVTGKSLEIYRFNGRTTLFSLAVSIHELLSYVLFGLKIDVPNNGNLLFQQVIKSIQFPEEL